MTSATDALDWIREQLLTLPWEGLALSRDEPAISTRFVGFPAQ